MSLFGTAMKLLGAVSSAAASLPEFKALVNEVADTLPEKDQATLKQTYALAVQRSNVAHEELQALVAKHTSPG